MIGPSRYARFRVRVPLLAVLAVFVYFVAAPADDRVTAPKGYSSRAAVALAIKLGQLKLVDTKIDVPETVTVRKDIQYGTGGQVPLLLDLYRPIDNASPRPGLVFIHGGSWRSGKRSDYHYYGVKFAEAGYVVATISYRLTKIAPFPAAVQDAKCAVRWMRASAAELGVDPQRIAVAGGSAGGHLAMMVGYSSTSAELEGSGGHEGVSSSVQAVVNLYGPTDLTVEAARENKVVVEFLGGNQFADDRRPFELASPLFHVSADDPPTLILHGTIDEIVPIRHADVLAEKLRAVGVSVDYHRLDGWPHAMDAASDVNRYCVNLILAFLEAHLGRTSS